MSIWTKIFKKKEDKGPTPCNHKYKDFHWYTEVSYDEENYSFPYTVAIIAPYVCVKCKERRNEILHEYNFKTKSSAFKCEEKFAKEFPDHIRPLLLIEDEIKDMQLIDREYLDQVDKMIHPEYYDINLFDKKDKI